MSEDVATDVACVERTCGRRFWRDRSADGAGSDGEKIAIVREASDGRSSVAEVARRHDLSRQQIYQWRSAMRRGELVQGDGGRFLAVEFAGDLTAGAAGRADGLCDAVVEVSLRKGRALRVPASIAPAVLTALIRAAEAA